ncbi:MAG: holo-[acyl-carrier-protein] synthase [Candidatus Makaraimicrobium thalassicum]|nr:MAG: holo-[acyl-carrier-protein] synthase [Candidatus Omnitrophota bacterium]
MNIAGIGIDALKIERFKKAIEQRGENFLKRIFTQKELEYAGSKKAFYVHMAGKFAAKEAVKKALPDGAELGLNWSDIEILNGKDGKPYALLHGQAEYLMKKYNLSQMVVSISHTDDLAVSNAMGVHDGT